MPAGSSDIRYRGFGDISYCQVPSHIQPDNDPEVMEAGDLPLEDRTDWGDLECVFTALNPKP